MMPKVKTIKGCPPIESGRQKTFTSSENNRKHIGDNPDGLYCRKFRVDGNILTAADGKKCDYLLVNDEGKDAYFIELKGSEIDDAPKQLEASIAALKDDLSGYFFFQRIICSKACTHKMKGSTITHWLKKHNGKHHNQPIALIKETQHTDLMVR